MCLQKVFLVEEKKQTQVRHRSTWVCIFTYVNLFEFKNIDDPCLIQACRATLVWLFLPGGRFFLCWILQKTVISITRDLIEIYRFLPQKILSLGIVILIFQRRKNV